MLTRHFVHIIALIVIMEAHLIQSELLNDVTFCEQSLSCTLLPIFAGPATYSRSLAARQLAWLVRQLERRTLAPAVHCILPALLAMLDDPSPFVESQGTRCCSDPCAL